MAGAVIPDLIRDRQDTDTIKMYLKTTYQSSQGAGLSFVFSFQSWKWRIVALPSSVSVKILPMACRVLTLSPAFTYTWLRLL